MARVAIYVRVSTAGQTTENQLRELRAVAKREGHNVVAEFTDSGISGAKNRDARPGLNSLLEGVTRREFDKVMAWSVDRLGRSLQDLLTFIAELKAKGVDLYLHQQHLDTSTPSGKAMYQMCGVFAEFEGMAQDTLHTGIWGKRCTLTQVLKADDRVEIYRPLL